MAHRNRNSRRRDSAPGWVWMLFGLGVGLIIAIGVYLRIPAPAAVPAAAGTAVSAPAPQPPPPTERTRPQAQPRSTAARAPDESRFEFYEILPQFEVVVPDEDDEPPPATRPRPAATPGSFLLQAGSFSAAADADRLQANLALLGIESHVQRVTIDNAAFNRVRIGPIGDLDAAKRTQRRLRDAGIDTLLMQVPK